MAAEDNISRTLQLLQGAIRASGRTQTEIDEKIGRRRGYLSHVFQRRVDLKLIDLLKALEVLELEPRRFFSAVVSHRSGSAGVLQLLAGRGAAADGSGEKGGPATANPRDPDLEERVRRALRAILSEGQERR